MSSAIVKFVASVKQEIIMDQTAKIISIVICIIFLLYFFICSLSIFKVAFQLLCSNLSTSVLAYTNLGNPILGLMLGVISTAIIQSSSATTSIVVAMAAGGIITLREGIPVVMGSNVGTSITSTMVSLTNLHNIEEYRLGFTAAILHDIFNWCTILLLLPLEMGTGALERVTGYIADQFDSGNNTDSGMEDHFQAFSKLFSSIADTFVILKSHAEVSDAKIKRLMHQHHEFESSESFESSEESLESLEISEMGLEQSSVESSEESSESVENYLNTTEYVISIIQEDCGESACDFWFANTGMSDLEIGIMNT